LKAALQEQKAAAAKKKEEREKAQVEAAEKAAAAEEDKLKKQVLSLQSELSSLKTKMAADADALAAHKTEVDSLKAKLEAKSQQLIDEKAKAASEASSASAHADADEKSRLLLEMEKSNEKIIELAKRLEEEKAAKASLKEKYESEAAELKESLAKSSTHSEGAITTLQSQVHSSSC
jgi:chromosome segregation ATPase